MLSFASLFLYSGGGLDVNFLHTFASTSNLGHISIYHESLDGAASEAWVLPRDGMTFNSVAARMQDPARHAWTPSHIAECFQTLRGTPGEGGVVLQCLSFGC